MKKNITLGIVLILIVGSVVYLESKKAHFSGPVGAGPSVTVPAAIAPTAAPASSSATSPSISAITPSIAATAAATQAKLLSADVAAGFQLAKELVTPDGFINTPGDNPITISQYVGKKVILVDFWTYSCINCQRSIPYLNAWYQKYQNEGLEIIGIHAPEFDFEKDYANVQAAVTRLGIKYPVVLDSEHATWNSYGNEYWPEEYLIDINGYVVDRSIGEGNYADTEQKIQAALQDRKQVLGESGAVSSGLVSITQTVDANSPETYFGAGRNEYLANGTQSTTGMQTLTTPTTIIPNSLYLGGTWNFQDQYATSQSANATITYTYSAKNVYFVADAKTPVTFTIMRDGVPLPAANYGADVGANGTVTVNGARLYHLISEPDGGTHTLQIIISKPGLDAYTFTFG